MEYGSDNEYETAPPDTSHTSQHTTQRHGPDRSEKAAQIVRRGDLTLGHGAWIIEGFDEVFIAEKASEYTLIVAESAEDDCQCELHVRGLVLPVTDNMNAEPAQEAMPIDKGLPCRKLREKPMI